MLYLGTTNGITFFALLPAAVLVLLLVYAVYRYGITQKEKIVEVEKERVVVEEKLVYVTPPECENAGKLIIKKNNGVRPKQTLEYWMIQVKELQQKPRVTPKMVIPVAAKLEKFKSMVKYRDNVNVQKHIRHALNWCYKQISKVEYDLAKVEKDINKRQTNPKPVQSGQPAKSDATRSSQPPPEFPSRPAPPPTDPHDGIPVNPR